MPTMTDQPTESLSAKVRLVEPLLGFDDYVAFELSDIDPAGILVSLRSREDPALRFVLTRPEHFFHDYAPQLAPVVLHAVGAPDASKVHVFVILTIMNIRGVKESVTALLPIFMTFVVTHAILLVAIMGRTSAYTGKAVTWEDMLNSKVDTFPRLEWGDAPEPVIPRPGVSDLI